jgi:hypothetical protein
MKRYHDFVGVHRSGIYTNPLADVTNSAIFEKQGVNGEIKERFVGAQTPDRALFNMGLSGVSPRQATG